MSEPTPAPLRVRNVSGHPEPLPSGQVLAPLAYETVDSNDPRVTDLLSAGRLLEVTEEQEAGVESDVQPKKPRAQRKPRTRKTPTEEPAS